MVKTRAIVVSIALLAAISSASCQKKEPVKTADEQKAEKDKAAKITRDNPVYGEQVKALDKAKKDTEKAVQTAEEKLLKEGY